MDIFSKILKIQIFFPKKCVFADLDFVKLRQPDNKNLCNHQAKPYGLQQYKLVGLRKMTATQQKVWCDAQAKPNSLQR